MGKITVTIKQKDGSAMAINTESDPNKSLMELLVEYDFDVLATCGGMALCGTCCIDVIKELSALPKPLNEELDMLENLPHSNENSRLSCQLKLNQSIDGLFFQLNIDNS